MEKPFCVSAKRDSLHISRPSLVPNNSTDGKAAQSPHEHECQPKGMYSHSTIRCPQLQPNAFRTNWVRILRARQTRTQKILRPALHQRMGTWHVTGALSCLDSLVSKIQINKSISHHVFQTQVHFQSNRDTSGYHCSSHYKSRKCNQCKHAKAGARQPKAARPDPPPTNFGTGNPICKTIQ